MIREDPHVAHDVWLFGLVVVAMATSAPNWVFAFGAGAAVVYGARRSLDRRAARDDLAIDLARSLAVAHAAGQPPHATFAVVGRLIGEPAGGAGSSGAGNVALPPALADRLGDHAPSLVRLVESWAMPDAGARLQALARWIGEAGATLRVLQDRMRSRGPIRFVWSTIGVAGYLTTHLLLFRARAPILPARQEVVVVGLWAVGLFVQMILLDRLRRPRGRARTLLEDALHPPAPADPSAPPASVLAPEERALEALEVYRSTSLRSVELCRLAASFVGMAPVALAMIRPFLLLESAITGVHVGLR